MALSIAFLNEKGGVGKTTSVVEFANQLGSVSAKKVLIVDLDGQANISTMMLDTTPTCTIADLLLQTPAKKLHDAVFPARSAWNNCAVLPSDKRLSGIESQLSSRLQREFILKNILNPLQSIFDFILFDLPPAINLITVNALVAATHYVIPTDTSEYSLQGIRSVESLAELIRSSGLNQDLQNLGVLITCYQKGISTSVKAFISELEAEFPTNPFKDYKIPHSTKIGESQKAHIPLGALQPGNPVSIAYQKAAQVILSSTH